MLKAQPFDVSAPADDELSRTYIVEFLAELLRITGTPDNQKDFQTALQKYCDGLRPWLETSDGPTHPRAAFSLFDSCAFDETGDHVSVVFSPEAHALFRAWLRRHKICGDAGLDTARAWSIDRW
jgi:hypothetical protein